jgi:hypothetical protein
MRDTNLVAGLGEPWCLCRSKPMTRLENLKTGGVVWGSSRMPLRMALGDRSGRQVVGEPVIQAGSQGRCRPTCGSERVRSKLLPPKRHPRGDSEQGPCYRLIHGRTIDPIFPP